MLFTGYVIVTSHNDVHEKRQYMTNKHPTLKFNAHVNNKAEKQAVDIDFFRLYLEELCSNYVGGFGL